MFSRVNFAAKGAHFIMIFSYVIAFTYNIYPEIQPTLVELLSIITFI